MLHQINVALVIVAIIQIPREFAKHVLQKDVQNVMQHQELVQHVQVDIIYQEQLVLNVQQRFPIVTHVHQQHHVQLV